MALGPPGLSRRSARSPTMDEVVEVFLDARRGLVVSAAGCGKTQLVARAVAHPRSGRQLVLTHTHAGVAALKRRFDRLGIPPEKYRLDTIAGWCLLYATAYPNLSGLSTGDHANPDWSSVYPASLGVVGRSLGHRVIAASYDGVLVDEYQDCSVSQHLVVRAIAETVPCRVVGDPLQAIFGFRRDDPMVAWPDVEAFFQRMPDLEMPWRWMSANQKLGEWLINARRELVSDGRLTIELGAPVEWMRWDEDGEIECCRSWNGKRTDRVVAIKKWPADCVRVAARLGGRFEVVEAFDDRELPRLAESASTAPGEDVVRLVHGYVRERMTGVGPALDGLVAAIAEGRSTRRFRTHLDHRDRLEQVALSPTPETLLVLLEGFRSHPGWSIYRPEGWYQLRSALRECFGIGLGQLPDAVAAVRTRARHRGRHAPWRTLGTTLLVKGLEFDDAVVLEADGLSVNELYVAITRGARSLRVLSSSRLLRPTS
jgi:hypothetical protein